MERLRLERSKTIERRLGPLEWAAVAVTLAAGAYTIFFNSNHETPEADREGIEIRAMPPGHYERQKDNTNAISSIVPVDYSEPTSKDWYNAWDSPERGFVYDGQLE